MVQKVKLNNGVEMPMEGFGDIPDTGYSVRTGCTGCH